MNFPIIQDTYQFECAMCGNCCTGDQHVNLNPYDLYKIAKFKAYDHTRKLFEENFIHLVQSQNKAWVPQIKFKSISKKKLRFCPFLINELNDQNKLMGLCNLHPDKKPLICAMAPVGRTIDFTDNSEIYIFVNPAPDCPGVNRNKENRLDDLKKLMSDGLEYEKQFLKMLDQIVLKNLPKEFYFEHFYSFSIDKSFKEIINSIINFFK